MKEAIYLQSSEDHAYHKHFILLTCLIYVPFSFVQTSKTEIRTNTERLFFLGRGNLDKKPHLVKWSTVCSKKTDGGLSVKGLSKMNKALLCKWIWHFANEKDSL